MNESDQTNNQVEISIDTEAGLQQFKQHVSDAYEELRLLLQSDQLNSEYVDITRRKGMITYEGLRSEIGNSLVSVVSGGSVNSERLQELYNTLIELSAQLSQQLETKKTGSSQLSPYADKVTRPNRQRASRYIAQALKVPRYKEIAVAKYNSPAHLEAALEREVKRAEAPSKLDTLLGVKYNSAFFTLLRDMTIDELLEFDALPGAEIRVHLAEINIDYYIYSSWIKALPGMLDLVQPTEDITFGELFVQAEMEVLEMQSEN